jgi:hypothetical protein
MGVAQTGTRVSKLARNFALGPAQGAALGSLLLSLLALRTATLNMDGMLYVETARVFLSDGFATALDVFYWPFFPVVMAWVADTTGLGLEASGHLLDAAFLAATCGLLVSAAARVYPGTGWYACVVILVAPGINGYRDEMLREFGAWAFAVLALWLALRWDELPRWRIAIAVHAAIVLAALFRPEAAVLFPALILWQLFAAPPGDRWRRLLQIGGPPLVGGALLLVCYATGRLGASRLATDLGRLNVERFLAKAQAMAPAFVDARAMAPAFAPYVADHAPLILLFGSLALVPVAFANKMGLLLIPLLHALVAVPLRETLARGQLFLWAFLASFAALCVFVVDMQFMSGRYPAFLILFAVPLTGYGLWLLGRRFPGWKTAVAVVAVLAMMANVVDLRPGKQQFQEAGAWLANNVVESPRVFVASPRSAYYAGWRFTWRFSPQPSREQQRAELRAGLLDGRYDLAVLEVAHDEPSIEPWLRSASLRRIATFTDRRTGDAVIVAAQVGTDAHQPAKTGEE